MLERQAGRRRGRQKQFDVEESVSAGLRALDELDIRELLTGWLTWERLQTAAGDLYESHRGSSSSARNAVVGEVKRRFAKSDEPPDPHPWLIEQVAASAPLVDLIVRTDGPPYHRLRELLVDARAGNAEWPDSVVAAAEDIFDLGRTRMPEHPASRLDLLQLRFLNWRSGKPVSVDRDSRRKVARLLPRYHELWTDLITEFGRELVDGASVADLVEAIGGLEDGLIGRTRHASGAEIRSLRELFARSVVHLIAGATVPRS